MWLGPLFLITWAFVKSAGSGGITCPCVVIHTGAGESVIGLTVNFQLPWLMLGVTLHPYCRKAYGWMANINLGRSQALPTYLPFPRKQTYFSAFSALGGLKSLIDMIWFIP